MLFVLLDVEDDCAGDSDLGQQVEVTQDEKDLACVLILHFHELLECDQIIIRIFGVLSRESTLIVLIAVSLLHVVIVAELPVSERENVKSDLDYKDREVELGKLKIYITQVISRLLLVLIPVAASTCTAHLLAS
jgi:hypothetical protein